MTGPKQSVIGIRPELSIEKFRGGLYSPVSGGGRPCCLSGAVFTVDTDTGRCVDAQRFTV